jgi:ribonuclease BN (tRNA processing enzyme)
MYAVNVNKALLAAVAKLGCSLVAASCAAVALAAALALPAEPVTAQPASRTQIVLLGTGNSDPSPDRSGPATAIVVNGRAYVVDFGAGVVRRAAAAQERGISALDPVNIGHAFVTHLHSDHTVGYPDLIFTPWVGGRQRPLEVYGPPGLEQMTQHVLAAWSEDIKVRTGPLERPLLNVESYRVKAREVAPGAIYKDANVTVTAFNVRHGEWSARAYGYRFQTADRKIVISGDTSPSESVVQQCNGCDVLIHEVYTQAGYARAAPEWQRLYREYHTSTRQLAELATRAQPGLLILHHQSYRLGESSEEELLREMRAVYRGRFVSGHDLDVF